MSTLSPGVKAMWKSPPPPLFSQLPLYVPAPILSCAVNMPASNNIVVTLFILDPLPLHHDQNAHCRTLLDLRADGEIQSQRVCPRSAGKQRLVDQETPALIHHLADENGL